MRDPNRDRPAAAHAWPGTLAPSPRRVRSDIAVTCSYLNPSQRPAPPINVHPTQFVHGREAHHRAPFAHRDSEVLQAVRQVRETILRRLSLELGGAHLAIIAITTLAGGNQRAAVWRDLQPRPAIIQLTEQILDGFDSVRFCLTGAACIGMPCALKMS